MQPIHITSVKSHNTEPNKGMHYVLIKMYGTSLLMNLNFDIITFSFLWKPETPLTTAFKPKIEPNQGSYVLTLYC